MRVMFLDIDGVLNCQIFYQETKAKGLSFIDNQICKERVSWLNELCLEHEIKVVISSTWRLGRTLEELREIFIESGATFEIIGKTPNLKHEGCLRGNEILQWIKENEPLVGPYFDYKQFVIVDDDSDMLLWQKENFFQTDSYAGLTPNLCYKMGRFFKQFSATLPKMKSITSNNPPKQ